MSKTYHIIVIRHVYGSQANPKSRLIDEITGEDWHGTHAEARAKIAELDGQVYYTNHDESSRPTYTIVAD